ncbi:cytochrome P450 monooxygenase [Amylocystis lapponica]|nr:cytochrome P450 monooxygenase [Amylocystis lapponica]
MSDISPLISALLVGAATWFAWSFVRRSIIKPTLRNIPGPSASFFWTGNLGDYFERYGWEFNKKTTPMLYVYDPRAMQSILVKDQDIYDEAPDFIGHVFFVPMWRQVNLLAFGSGLLSTEGEYHRKQRKLLNPIFLVNQIRLMLPIFYQITDRLRDAITERVRDGPREVDMLELIGQGGLGCSLDPLTGDDVDGYATAAKAFLPTFLALAPLHPLLRYVRHVRRLGFARIQRRIVELIPHKKVQKFVNIIDTMDNRARSIYQAKKIAFEQGDKAVTHQVGEGKDIMSILMKANMKAEEEDRLPESEIIAQVSILIFTAMDTTSNTLARILHLLAEHPKVQEHLRKEIVEARGGENLAYEKLMQLPYLDAVIRETLRLAHQDVILPLSKPIRGVDGRMMSEIEVPRGTTVMIGILGWNRSKDVWGEDASEWKPERWLSSLPEAVTDAHIPGIFSHLMTFLGGGRACIGFKFAETEIKAVLATLVPSFVFKVEAPTYWNMAGVKYPTVGKESE